MIEQTQNTYPPCTGTSHRLTPITPMPAVIPCSRQDHHNLAHCTITHLNTHAPNNFWLAAHATPQVRQPFVRNTDPPLHKQRQMRASRYTKTYSP